MQHFNVCFRPDNKQVSIHAGAILIEAAELAGIILNTVCGQKGTCRKCAVILEPDQQEVLACQYKIQSDLVVTIPPSSRFFEHKILVSGIDIESKNHPTIYKQYLKTAADTGIFGLAVDIGTTTVVAKLIDMRTGTSCATHADMNPQTRHGDDVVSRINYAQNDSKLAELQKVILDCINTLTAKLCEQASIKCDQIYEVCVVGNTTMNHIFLGLPVTQLGQAPYKAYSVKAKDLSPNELSLQINPTGNIHTVENIAGFVGSDTIAVALAVDIASADQATLIVDIGTNSEVVLGCNDKLYAASCAAGPALEGARITHGSRAVDGAIEAVIINQDDIDIDVIENGPPHSICGSGLIDAVAVMLDLGVIDNTGRFTEPKKLKQTLSPRIFSRITEHNNQPAFCLTVAETSKQQRVILTQQDIRQFQLAKAAIRTGIKLLQNKFSLEDGDIQKILLAGAFGNYIRKESALRIGLLPQVPHERIQFVGNAASSGSQMILLSQNTRQNAKNLAQKIEYIEIANDPTFTDIYAECMMF